MSNSMNIWSLAKKWSKSVRIFSDMNECVTVFLFTSYHCLICLKSTCHVACQFAWNLNFVSLDIVISAICFDIFA